MTTLVQEPEGTVAGEKPGKDRERVDLRAEREWIERVRAVAARFGLSLSAYIRQAVTKQVEQDEATGPAKGKGGRS